MDNCVAEIVVQKKSSEGQEKFVKAAVALCELAG